MSDRKLVIAVDFDGVLMDPLNVEPGYKMGKPIAGATEGMRALHHAGHKLIIHTTRATGVDVGKHVHTWLHYFGFPPVYGVTSVKPDADVYLDDRAVRFVNWNHALMAIEAERQ